MAVRSKKNIVKNFILMTGLLFSAVGAVAQNSSQKASSPPFQGVKEFCSFTHSSKYTVTIKGISAVIVFSYNEDTTTIKGTFKNGKLYTNDADEKADKALIGKLYQVTDKSFRILNPDTGDYNEYHICN